MPTQDFELSASYPVESVIAMAEQIGKLTRTVVVCKPVLKVEAAAPVLKALEALLPLSKKKRKNAAQDVDSPEGVQP